MKLLSIFFLFCLLAVAIARENDPCDVSPDCEKGEYCIDGTCTRYIQGGGFVADFAACRNQNECSNGQSCVVGKCQYECNPKCAEGLACLQGICVDGN